MVKGSSIGYGCPRILCNLKAFSVMFLLFKAMYISTVYIEIRKELKGTETGYQVRSGDFKNTN